MIVIHHLAHSRSHRILWLMEELELPYEVAHYARDGIEAPADLLKIHALGKSPVISDGKRTIAESGAIIEYLIEIHGGGRLRPAIGSDDWVRYLQWMHLTEGSLTLPMVLGIYLGILGPGGLPLKPRADSEIERHFDFVERELDGRFFIVGESLTGADIQLSFVLEAAIAAGSLGDRPGCLDYVERMRARPAYGRALDRGGPFDLSMLHRRPDA